MEWLLVDRKLCKRRECVLTVISVPPSRPAPLFVWQDSERICAGAA